MVPQDLNWNQRILYPRVNQLSIQIAEMKGPGFKPDVFSIVYGPTKVGLGPD
jgi:hypothetical protein